MNKKSNEQHTKELRERSGHVVIDSYLVAFLYTLMRDHLPIADVETLVRDSEEESLCTYTNGWLAKYAEDLAKRLTKESTAEVSEVNVLAPGSGGDV